MRRVRTTLLTASVTVVLLFAGLLMANRHRQDDLFKSLGLLAEVVHLVHSEYVQPLDTETLEMSLDAGLVQSVDPRAAVVPGDRLDEYRAVLELPPAFGLCLTVRFSSAAVRHALAGSPAAEAGLETWEVVELIDGIYTRGRPLWQIRLDLAERASRDKPVTLTVLDIFGDERREVVLQPAKWQPQPVSVEEHEGVRVVKVHSLPRNSVPAIREAIAGDAPFILDLRQLVWGFDDSAVEVADLFVSEGELAAWRGNRVGEESFEATAGRVAAQMPLVLINPNTEGCGEILAAGLQRAGAAMVGYRTAGHASHMRLIHDGDLHLWIPVAYWLRADATPIHRQGVEPEYEVEPVEAEEGADPVLRRALELIHELHGQEAAA